MGGHCCFPFFDSVKDKNSKLPISTVVLTIKKVSSKDFQTQFTCIGKGFYIILSKNITLRQRGERPCPCLLSIARAAFLMLLFLLTEIGFSVDVQNVSVLLSCLLVVVLLKCFFIDIVLLFRPCLSLINYKTGEEELFIHLQPWKIH